MIYAQQQIVVPLSCTHKKKQIHPALVLETLENIDDKKKAVEKFWENSKEVKETNV